MTNAPQGIQIGCPSCGQRFPAMVESIVDGGRDPNAKARFLTGRTNVVQCPYCGAVVQLSIPIVYHDHTKELLLIYFPQQLNIPQQERESIIGEMTRTIMNSLPQDQRKGYLFKPVMPLTMEGMTEFVLEKEGITKEVIAAQREKMKLVEEFITADEDKLPALVKQHDAEIGSEFFQMMTLSAEAALSSGRKSAAENIIARRDTLLDMTTFGKEAMQVAQRQETVIAEVANWLQSQGQQLTIDGFVDYVEKVGDSDDHLQALAGLVRPAMNQQFFSALDQRIGNAKGDKQEKLSHIKERLIDLVDALDQQQQAIVQQAQQLLQQILNAPDMEQAIDQAIGMIDDLFMSVLAANIQAAERRGDLLGAARFKNVYEKIVERLQASAPPEVRFINDLLNSGDPLEAKLMLSERAADYGKPLVAYMDALIQNLGANGQEDLADQLAEYREAAAKIVGEPE